MTVCNNCGAEMPLDRMEENVGAPEEVVTFGSLCLACGEGTYSQHEDALSLQINQLQAARTHREKLRAAGNTAHEVEVAEQLNVSDASKGAKG